MPPAHRQARDGRAFAALHAAPHGFIMPNAWDAGSAAILAAAGFPAIATTSAGIAFSLARQDYGVTHPGLAVPLEDMLARCRQIVDAVGVPVNGDLEAGYGDDPDIVARTIGLAIEAGLAGANIEDRPPREPRLYDEGLAVERIAAARAEIARRGAAFVLTARTDALVWNGDTGLADAIRRSNRYRAAGADVAYAPGAADSATVATLVGAIDGPLNVVLGLGGVEGNALALLELGVRRVSLGGAIARAALGFVRRCAAELAETGGVTFAEGQIHGAELNGLFAHQAP